MFSGIRIPKRALRANGKVFFHSFLQQIKMTYFRYFRYAIFQMGLFLLSVIFLCILPYTFCKAIFPVHCIVCI